MKSLFCLAFVMSLCIAIAAQSAPKPATVTAVIDSIRIEVQGGKSLQLKAADFAKLPRREVKAKDHDGKDTTYSGVELREVLKLAGAKFGADLRGKEMANYLLVEAADNYHAVYALAELDDTYTDRIVILADTQDGKPLDAKNGPWQIVVPGERKHARWVRQVTRLSVRAAGEKTVAKSADLLLSDEDSVYLVVFANIVKVWSGRGPIYVGVDGGDPSVALLSRLSQLSPGVKRVSDSTIDWDKGSLVRDSETGQEGVFCKGSKLQWLSKDEVKLEAGTYLGNMGADRCSYLLRRENGEWKIISRENCWVS